MLTIEKTTHFYIRPEPFELEEFKTSLPTLVQKYYDHAKGPTVLDMRALKTLDSMVLGSIIVASNRAEKAGFKLALINVGENIKNILDISRMSSKLSVFESEDAALLKLASQ